MLNKYKIYVVRDSQEKGHKIDKDGNLEVGACIKSKREEETCLKKILRHG